MKDIILIVESNDNEDTSQGGDKGFFGGGSKESMVSRFKEVKLDPNKLEETLSDFVGLISRTFQSLDKKIKQSSSIELSEVELLIEIGAEGEVKLIAGGKATGKSAIKLKFSRVKE
jgi:hypothetical protein